MRTTALVIGAGHAGLAMSRCLAERSIDHAVVERGEIANSWKTERWDSLRLLTPNWQSRLPGHSYRGGDPDGFRSMRETIELIEQYALSIAAPVYTGTTVTAVQARDDGFAVATDRGDWRCRAIVIATGACGIPSVPLCAAGVPGRIATFTTAQYRNPAQLPSGAVLVVGASASGVQIADELAQAGFPVTLAVGAHIRMPRVYRGRDIQWWMDAAGIQDDRIESMDDAERARNLPSLQLAGYSDGRMADLNALTEIGVRLVGRLAAIRDGRALFSGSLAHVAAMSDLKMNRLLDRIDQWASQSGLDGGVDPPRRFEPTRIETSPRLEIDLRSGEFGTIIWATGYRPDHSWLHAPVFDRKGRIRHDRGIVEIPGLYLMGMPFMRRRKSTLIDGAGADARELCAHLAGWLAQPRHAAESAWRICASPSDAGHSPVGLSRPSTSTHDTHP
jgi:putative flavoprotein involved in K+ transport